MAKTIVGTRIRERRRAMGLTQTALAEKLSISPSYLNLIEHNKRGIAGALLRRTAGALDMPLEQLDGAAEQQLLDVLSEIAYQPAVKAANVELDAAGEFIGRYPGWARALATLARSEYEATTTARALADRLTHDPFLGETVHRMLTRVAAIRSTAEILTEFPDIPPDKRDRFNQIIHDESVALTDVGEALASYFDKAEETGETLTPLDELEALFDARENRFDEIEEAALKIDLGADPSPKPRRTKAQGLARARLGPLIDDIVSRQSELETQQARKRARAALLFYAVGAILAPMAHFKARAVELGYDFEALSDSFAMEIELTCHRLIALPREEGVPRFGYVQANAAGALITMHGLPGLAAPRYASACPLWALFRAQQSPESVIRQRVLLPSGARFVFLARARNTGPTGFGKPRHYITDMLALSEADAAATIYAPGNSVPVEEVGLACRICPRKSCAHRVEDPLTG